MFCVKKTVINYHAIVLSWDVRFAHEAFRSFAAGRDTSLFLGVYTVDGWMDGWMDGWIGPGGLYRRRRPRRDETKFSFGLEVAPPYYHITHMLMLKGHGYGLPMRRPAFLAW